ncbi:MAG TPA: Uma2 family endonuclease [Aggregatilineaceae bacterium]|nr:Uma2 family endonuclease [Aggregatilineaceae bacterium]
MVATQRMTVDEFDQFVEKPENAERLFEYIGGDIVEVVSNQRSSEVTARISGYLFIYLLQHPIGFLTSADGGYAIAGERYIPDVAFVSKAKQAEPSDQAYGLVPPDLAVEVLSPANDPDDMRIKVGNYLAVGTVVWIVNPIKKQVQVFVPGQPVQRIGLDGTIEGGDVLPGFRLAVKDIFPA